MDKKNELKKKCKKKNKQLEKMEEVISVEAAQNSKIIQDKKA